MPKFYAYSSTVLDLVASRMVEAGESDDADMTELNNRKGKYSYFVKNAMVYIISAILQYASVNSILSVLTSLAGEQKGFVTLVVTYVAGYLTVITPGLITSLGCKKVIVIVNIGYLLFSIGNFYTEYYTLLPASVFGGYSIVSVWVCGTTYLNTLGMNYAKTHKTTENKMISYTNGISMACFSSGMLVGNLVSSSLLSPTRDNDAGKPVNTTEQSVFLRTRKSFRESMGLYFEGYINRHVCCCSDSVSVFLG